MTLTKLSKYFLFVKFVEIGVKAPDLMTSNLVHVKYLCYCEKNNPTLEYTINIITDRSAFECTT